MKNVLFATTALVAFAGAASAASHGGMAPAISFSGEVTAGYNDEVDDGIFWDANIDVAASVDLGDNVTASLTAELVSADEFGGSVTFKPTIEITYAAGTFNASLTVGDLNDKGASEYFYATRSGMSVEVENHDTTSDVRALLEFGNFGVAIGCENLTTGFGTCNDGAYNVGAGATFGSIKLGVGYDNDILTQVGKTAVSADATFGSFDVGVSYATSTPETSIGIEVGATFGAAKVGAYYANNSASDDEYGVSVDYTAGAITVGVYYNNVDDGAATSGRGEYGVDVAYAVSERLTVKAGYFQGEATVYAPITFATSDVVDAYYQVGIDYAVNDNISATVSYATANEFGAAEYKQGISAFITASF